MNREIEFRGKPWKVIGNPWCWVVDTEGGRTNE